MTDYEIRFTRLLKNTGIGFGIGLIVSIIIAVSRHYSLGDSAAMILVFTFLIGSLASVLISAKSGLVGAANGLIRTVFKGITTACFKMPTGSGIMFALSLVKAIIGFFLLIPLCLYIVISYPINLIYLGIMTMFERKGKLEEKASVIKILDILVPIISIILVIIICSVLIKCA